MQSVFKCKDYKEFIEAAISSNESIRGYQGKLARAARCHRSYLSQVLRSNKNLNLEQAMKMAIFWGLQASEIDYFVELVNYARTEFQPLKNLIKRRLEQLRRESQNLAKRYTDATPPIGTYALEYYSSWHYGAIHMLMGLNEPLTGESIARRLQLPLPIVEGALRFLATNGMMESYNGKWRAKPGHLHIPNDSPLCSLNHSNWRQRAVIDSQIPYSDSIHYTSAQSHAVSDFQKIKDLILNMLDSTRKIVAPAKNEEVTAICVDFYRL